MRRVIGIVLLVPGLALLAFGAWLLADMMAERIYSIRALLCCALIGGGLALTGARLVLRPDADD